MLQPRRALVLGLLMALGACAQPVGVSPTRHETESSRSVLLAQPLDAIRLNRPFLLYSLIRLSTPVEASILARIQAMRTAAQREPLVRDSKLDEAARAHSWAMTMNQQGFLVSPDGKGIEDRLKEAGVSYGWWAGYAWGPVNATDPHYMAIIILQKLDKNFVLNPSSRRVGVAVYRRFGKPVDKVYSTVVFTD